MGRIHIALCRVAEVNHAAPLVSATVYLSQVLVSSGTTQLTTTVFTPDVTASATPHEFKNQNYKLAWVVTNTGVPGTDTVVFFQIGTSPVALATGVGCHAVPPGGRVAVVSEASLEFCAIINSA